jgi:hypothetical protein
MSYSDWDPVVLDKRGRRNVGESKDAAVARAVRTGMAVAEQRGEEARSRQRPSFQPPRRRGCSPLSPHAP